METVAAINKRLIDYFGLDTVSSRPIWRIVWSETQFEKRYGTYRDFTSNGLFIRDVTEWREVPKYRQWIHNKHVLERLTLVPAVNEAELTEKTSYEPIWVFEDKIGNALPPKFEAAKFVIDTLNAAAGKQSMRKYVEDADEQRQETRVDKLVEELFGNETDTGDALAYGDAIVVPQNYERKN